jgi:hypothetical protein
VLKIPDEVREVVVKAAREHPDARQATVCALEKVRALPGHAGFLAALEEHSVSELVYDARHEMNRERRPEEGPRPPGGVRPPGEALGRVYDNLYQYRIGGTTLGRLKGEDLLPLAEQEGQKGRGHLLNEALLRWCDAQGVPEGAEVQDHVSEAKLRAARARLARKIGGEAA